MISLNKFLTASVAVCLAFSCTCPNPSAVRTDALEDASWKVSTWISAADAEVTHGDPNVNCRAADGSSWFVSSVENDKKVISAVWMTTGLGVYELYVNGQAVGNEILKPGFTHHDKTKRSFTYDITPLFKCKAGAVNVLSAQSTPGWWADKIVTHNSKDGMIGKKCAFRAVLQLTYSDGSKELLGTDISNWKAGIAGPVKHAAIFDGEEYDAREVPGFKCVDKLGVPEVNDEFHGEILPSDGAEIYLRTDLTLSPVKAYTWRDIEGASDDAFGKVVIVKEFGPNEEIVVNPGETLVVDFGQNCAAVPSFCFKAAEGTRLVCLPGELLNDGNGAHSRGMDGPEGSVHRTNLRIPNDGIRLYYTFAGGDKFVSYYPHCTFFGYRFVSVTASDTVYIKSISSIPVTSISKELVTGTIETGNVLVNKLISNTVWGQMSNYLSVSTDCPQRNERLGWTADTQVFTETGTFFANTDGFFHKWLRDMRDSQSETGAFPGVAPTAQYGNEMMRLGWADAGIIVPWTIWKQYGDNSIVDEHWESMEKFMNHANETKYDHNALAGENLNYQWADWLSYEPLESCSGRAFTKDASGKRVPKPEAVTYWNYLSAAYWAIDASMMLDMARSAGKDVAKYETMLSDAKSYLCSNFLTEDGKFKEEILNTMQTPALFALKIGLVEGDAKADMIARLRENFIEHDNCLQTGFLGTSILMGTLTDNGLSDVAYELLFQRKNPSWIYSIDNGATTIWERWNSYTLESGLGPKGMNSFNHYAYGAVCQWIWETVAGINADTGNPGFKHIIFKPVPDERLGYVNAEFKSASGLIKSSWKYSDGKWVWNFTVPEGTTASVYLPGEVESTEYTPGTYTIEK